MDPMDDALSEFRWNLKMLLRFGYPEGIRLDLLESTYHLYYDKIIAPNLIQANTERWEDVFEHVPSLEITFTTSETGNHGSHNSFLIKLRFADNEEDHGQLADVLKLVSYPNYVKAKAERTVDPTNPPTVETATSSTGTGTGEGPCHIPTFTLPMWALLGSPIQIYNVPSVTIGSSTVVRTPELNRETGLDSQTQRLFPGPSVITRGPSELFSSNGESSSVSTSTRTQTPTKKGEAVGRGTGQKRGRGRPPKIQTKPKGSLNMESTSELETGRKFSSSSCNCKFPGLSAGSYGTGPFQPATEVVLNSQSVETLMAQNSQPSTAVVIPVATGTVQSAEPVATVVRPASEQERSQSAALAAQPRQPVVLPIPQLEKIPIIVKVESARETRLFTPTTQTIQNFIDLSQDSGDEDENEANHSSTISVNAGNSTSTSDLSDNVAFATPRHAESVAAENCANIVHPVAQPVLPVEFVHVKQELLDNVAEQSPVPLIAAVSCRLNVEPNQSNGDRQDVPVMSIPSVVVKLETNENENDLAAVAVPVPTSRDDHGQVGEKLNIREPQPPLHTEIRFESRPIKVEDEDMSAAGNPLGNVMGTETQETTSLLPPYSAVVNSRTSVYLNLTPTTANTVMNSPRQGVTALESNSHPNTPIKTEQLPPVETSPMASTAVTATLTEVSTTTMNSGEFVHENTNSPATQLPVSAIFSRTPLQTNIGYPNRSHHGPQFNIFRSRNGDTNKNQPILLKGPVNSVPTVAVNNSATPEQVITLIEGLKANGGLKRMDGTVAQFTTFPCRLIRVGSSRAIKSLHNLVTISDIGILFDFPHSQTDSIVRCAVPADQVLSVHVHFSARIPLIVVTTSPRYAVWLRGRLGMPNYFCPLKGGPSQKHLMLMLDKFTAMDMSVINKVYKRILVELNYDEANALLMNTTLEDHTPGQVGIQLSNRGPQPPISTESPIESRAIKAEDMSTVGIPLGNMMGAEIQETAVGNSQTPVNLNLTRAAAKTVNNSAREKANSDPDWELEPGPSRRSSRNGRIHSGNIKRPTTAGTPRTLTKRVKKDDNASGQSSDVGPSHNLEDDSRDVELRTPV